MKANLHGLNSLANHVEICKIVINELVVDTFISSFLGLRFLIIVAVTKVYFFRLY